MVDTIQSWVKDCVELTRPEKVIWCDGSRSEYDMLIRSMLADGSLHQLNPKTYPNCFLHRSNPNDVARTEKLTFICTSSRDDAGPNNNWMAPDEAKKKMRDLFDGSMRGRTMYVIPYLMGPASSPYSKVGAEITDSAYVAANMHIMTRVGTEAMQHYERSHEFVPGLHSLGDLSPDRRFIMHFPEEKSIMSFGSGYGGNALLGKKCFALRVASYMARQQGWLAEHMLIIGLQDPSGKVTYMAVAFPSASGKTNLAMMVSSLADRGYKVWTVGDDIAWLHIDGQGQLRAINPEAGFFGVAPGTSHETNPVAMHTMEKNSIFTNVALTPANEPWWEGFGTPPPVGLIDWRGNPWNNDGKPAAHPNSRFTSPARQCPIISPAWEDPEGVPIAAIVFGSRRTDTIPLVSQAFTWDHGVFMGASMGAETTAAATGTVGVVRRDPMAMLPFCGYNMGDYFGYWLSLGKRLKKPPLVFRVNWFRKDEAGRFLWPGYGDNIRVLKWILGRIYGRGEAVESPIGLLPTPDSIYISGIRLQNQTMQKVLSVDVGAWERETDEIEKFFNQFGDRIPQQMWDEVAALKNRLSAASR
jgi:phosphoenolpyruvate carboxykinase (GTP)